ncbi:hypothetical protein CFP65_0167 [Kitasatospora sp. MMS16-BH015]|uniref:FtsX-like permease family protein n=1 Tax=Kitasatospora sp. MMS16-BH015 TaxID=2018025 RepID=UPI000CA36451|nr:FtsX-like permease family protein [Kitasatospora sp. MMS16-BH015]AUG75150.1 hypothetical protein CFP65_0167 [Kitasatospora sp. MMS16-BH015]
MTTTPGPGAPWTRTRLRAARPAAVVAFLLAFVTVLLATALPRALDRGADQALQRYLTDYSPTAASLLGTAGPARGVGEEPEGDKELTETADTLGKSLHDPLALAGRGVVYGKRTVQGRSVATPGLDQPDGIQPRLDLLYVHAFAEHAKLTAGTWPGRVTAADGAVPIAISESGARTLHAKLGMELYRADSTVRLVIVGLYSADDPGDPFFSGLGCTLEACQATTPGSPPARYWEVAAVLSDLAMDHLAAWSQPTEDFWRLPLRAESLRADRLEEIEAAVTGFLGGTTAVDMVGATGRPSLTFTSDLPSLLELARARQAAAAPLAAIGPAGAIGVAVVLLCLAAALTADRRAGELALLSARGASRTGLLRRLLTEALVTSLPGAVLGIGLALLLLPTPRWGGAVLLGTVVGLCALLAFPLRVAVAGLSRGKRPGRRRAMAELLVFAVTAAAVYELRRRGVAPTGEGLDTLLVSAPLTVALTGALVLARLQPVVVGGLARWAGRRPGVVGFLGLARAARGTGGQARPSVLPLLALVLAVTTAGFGATVIAGVDAARIQVSRLAVGGDTAVIGADGGPLPAGFAAKAAALPGTRQATAVWSEDEINLLDTDHTSVPRVTGVAADPAQYAALAAAVGRGRFDPALLATPAGWTPADPVPVLVTADLAYLNGRTFGMRTQEGGELRVTARGLVDGTPTVLGRDAPAVLVPVGPGTAQLDVLGRPNAWYAMGGTTEPQVRALLGGAKALYRSSATIGSAMAHDPLQHAAELLFWASVLAAMAFALLSVLLALVRAAPDRAALLARLRTMGLKPREGVALIMVEALPQAFTATAIGAVGAALAVSLVGPAIDLTTMVGSPVPTGLALATAPVLQQALALAGLCTLAVLAEAAVFGRRQITTELRAGDAR